MNGKTNTLMELLAHARHSTELDAEVLRVILNAEPEQDRPLLLKTYLEQTKIIKSDETMKLPPWLEGDAGLKLCIEYGRKMERELTRLVGKNLPGEEFYRRLWQYITTYIDLEGFDAGVAALFRCTVLDLLPYVHLDESKMVRMEQEEFADLMDSMRNTSLHEMRCILKGKMEQRTERAGLMLDLLDRCEGKERVVLMATILSENKTGALKLASLMGALAALD